MVLPSFSFDAASTTAAPGGAQLIVGEKFSISTPNADGSLKIPAWMQVLCATTGRTVQTSATTMLSGIGANVARGYSQDGITYGLLVEPVSTNELDEHDLNNWTPTGTPLINSITGPDGSVGDYEVEDDDGASVESLAYAITPGIVALPHTMSGWHLLTAPTPTSSSLLEYSDGINDPQITLTVVDPDWAFSETTVSDIGSGSFTIVPRATTVADVGAVGWFGIQLEQRSYATSWHATGRALEVIRCGAKAMMKDGFFTHALSYRPHYSDTTQSTDHNLIYLDADNRLFLRETDSTMVFVIDGEELTVGPITFTAHTELTITVEHSAKRRRLVVSGALTGDGTVKDDPLDPVLEPTWVYLLGSDTGAEEGSDLTAFDQDAQSFCDLILCRMLIQMDRDPGSRDFYDFLCALSEEVARLFDVLLILQSAFDLETAVGDQLDIIGSIVGLAREGQTDARYRIILEIQVELLLAGIRDDAEWTGTIPNVLRIARKFVDTPAGVVTYTGHPPYNFQLSLPVSIAASEVELLMRFLSVAAYAGVLGFVQFPLSTDVWGSDAVAVPDVGTWGSASVVVAGASIWDYVITTS